MLPKLAVAAGVTAVTVARAAVRGRRARRVGTARPGLAVARGVGALAYSALFLALSLVTRRPVLLGLVYVLIWEGLLGNFVSGTRVLSIQQYVIAIADRIAPTGLLETQRLGAGGVVMTAVFSVGFTVLAIDRLRSFSVAGETS